MSIHEMFADEDTDITADLRRKDHVIFIGNEEGYYSTEARGFTLINEIRDEHWTDLFSKAKGKVGDVISMYDEAEYVWWHCLIGYSVRRGWEIDGYVAIKEAYDKIWAQHEDEHVRPFRTTFVARGQMRTHGDTNGNIIYGTMVMADTDCRLAVYTRIPT